MTEGEQRAARNSEQCDYQRMRGAEIAKCRGAQPQGPAGLPQPEDEAHLKGTAADEWLQENVKHGSREDSKKVIKSCTRPKPII